MRIRTLLAAIGTSLSLGSVLAAPSQPVPVADERISVKVEGTGPDVILIPGLASSREVWRATADRLKATHRVHLVQLDQDGAARHAEWSMAGASGVAQVGAGWVVALFI